jgi:HPt (histidine-containing phosphotransfer) domain-containing protein
MLIVASSDSIPTLGLLMNYSALPSRPATGVDVTPNTIWSPPSLLLELASDDSQLLAELVDSFRTHAKTRMSKIRESLSKADFATIRNEAHSIKGSARQLGLEALGDASQLLEAAAGENPSLVAERLNRVQKALDEACLSMAYYLNGPGRPVEREGQWS